MGQTCLSLFYRKTIFMHIASPVKANMCKRYDVRAKYFDKPVDSTAGMQSRCHKAARHAVLLYYLTDAMSDSIV